MREMIDIDNALKRLKEYKSCYPKMIILPNKLIDALDRAIEALKKQIPTKVVRDSMYSPTLCPTWRNKKLS